MGSNPEACLAYGYDLGTDDDPQIAERGEYGFKLDWLDNADGKDEDADIHPTFPDVAEDRLLASVGFAETDYRVAGYHDRRRAAQEALGVDIEFSGGHDVPGYILAAVESKRSVQWAETMALDLDAMRDPARLADWDAKLASAVAALGITPKQDQPRWLVFPFYG